VKILVYGGGVQGTVYAARLMQARHAVTVLARGRRLEEIRNYGLMLRELPNGSVISAPIDVVEQLGPEDSYELVIVAVRRSQLQDILPRLAINSKVRMFLFLLNNAAGFDEITHLLGRSRVLAGFPTVGGSRDGHVICYTLIPPSSQPHWANSTAKLRIV
jgi:2-dehydropantoate 2-reductase